MDLKEHIRSIQNYPKKGVLFRDITTLIKNEKAFLKGNKFSRTAYEKFLLESNTNAASFEYNLSKQEKKNQLLNFIGGGIVPSHFVVNLAYDKINQQRDIEFINLNDIFKNKFNFSENNIQSYYNQNKETFTDIYKTINFAKLDPRILSGGNEFNDLFFRKMDEIDDLIVEGKSLKYISKKYNLESSTSFTIDSQGIDIKSKNKINFPDKLISKIIIIEVIYLKMHQKTHERSFILKKKRKKIMSIQ